MDETINIPGLRGTIYRRGKDSWRIQLSLGKNAQGKYDMKRETIRGTKQDAIDLLTRWNVEYLDHQLTSTNYQTVQQLYDDWIAFIEEYREPNTHKFYRIRFADDILPVIGHRKIKDVTETDLQGLLRKHPTKDVHNKRALSAFFGWCVKKKKLKENPCRLLETKAKPARKSESDVWNIEQVKKVYSSLTYENLYDVFIVFGIECGMRPQEILALTWDKLRDACITIDSAVKERTPTDVVIGDTKTTKPRVIYATPFLLEKLVLHREKQNSRIEKNSSYEDHGYIVADRNGHVPDLKYIRKYMLALADELEIPRVSPKDLRSTHISLLNDLNVSLATIQEQAGHSSPDVTMKHYMRVFNQSLFNATALLHKALHED